MDSSDQGPLLNLLNKFDYFHSLFPQGFLSFNSLIFPNLGWETSLIFRILYAWPGTNPNLSIVDLDIPPYPSDKLPLVNIHLLST